MKKTLICPFCKKPSKWCSNEEIYGRKLGKSYMCYWCKDCDAYVGCHNNTTKPLGTMANRELRQWRQAAHRHIDLIWKGVHKRKRGKVYMVLKEIFGREIHIGESDIETCKIITKIDFKKYFLY